MCYCLCHPLPSLRTSLFHACKSSKTTLKARSSFKMALSGGVKAQDSSGVRQKSYSSQTSTLQCLLQDQQHHIQLPEDLVTHFQIQESPLEPLHQHAVSEQSPLGTAVPTFFGGDLHPGGRQPAEPVLGDLHQALGRGAFRRRRRFPSQGVLLPEMEAAFQKRGGRGAVLLICRGTAKTHHHTVKKMVEG